MFTRLIFVLVATLSFFVANAKADSFSDFAQLFETATAPSLSDFSQSTLLDGNSVYVNEPDSLIAKIGLVDVETEGSYFFEYFPSSATSSWTLNDYIATFRKVKPSFRPLSLNTETNAVESWNTKSLYEIRKGMNAQKISYLIVERLCNNSAGCHFPYSPQGNITYPYSYRQVVDYSYYKLGR